MEFFGRVPFLILSLVSFYCRMLPSSTAAGTGANCLQMGDHILASRGCLVSRNLKFRLCPTSDGSTCIRSADDSQWCLNNGKQISNDNRALVLIFQEDGNLVLYGKNIALWSTNATSPLPAYVNLQDDGNLVLYDGLDNAYWNCHDSLGCPLTSACSSSTSTCSICSNLKLPTKEKRSTRMNILHSNLEQELVTVLAIVFPQFHPIPENDQFWGKNFTEWTLLKPLPRFIGAEIIKKPHPDIGYYNLLDYNHRKYMRILANRHGISGFIFYHFWFKDHPVMYKPVESMLRDGEPNVPFVFCWANEAWSKRWDGSDKEVLLAQDYSDVEGNTQHFLHLLKFFKHKNYIKIRGKPVFIFYRIEDHDTAEIQAIIKLWKSLALQHGLKGITFAKFNGPFENKIMLEDIDAYFEFEPGYSSRLKEGPNFVNGVYKGTENVNYVYGAAYRDSLRIWDRIENRANENPDFPFFRGSFYSWNNAPRRNWTNNNFGSYPTIYTGGNITAFDAHLSKMKHMIPLNKQYTFRDLQSYFTLTAWNEWNEQSIFEPNDIDGYDLLKVVKKNFMHHTGKTIVHMAHRGGGVERHIHDLAYLFGEYSHIYTSALSILSAPPQGTILLHIHSAMVRDYWTKELIGWDIIRHIQDHYKSRNISIYLTVHDYQWLFPTNPNIVFEAFMTSTPEKYDLVNTERLLRLVDKIIFPSNNVLLGYKKFVNIPNAKAVVVPHCDIIHDHSFTHVPPIKRRPMDGCKVINVVLFSRYEIFKGSQIFSLVASKAKKMTVRAKNSGGGNGEFNETFCIEYHAFSSSGQVSKMEERLINFYPEYAEEEVAEVMKKLNIHIAMFLSTVAETYGYALSQALSIGLPVVYLGRGAISERLAHVERAFKASTVASKDIFGAFSSALQFILSRSCTKQPHNPLQYISKEVQPNRWYLENYPKPFMTP